MAFLRFNGADVPIDMTDGTNTFEGTLNTSATQWQFATGSNATAIAFGEGMTFDEGNKPTGGTVNELQLRLGAIDTIDASVSGFSVSATLLRSNNIWDVILTGNDIINTQGLDAASVGSGTSQIFGDISLALGGTGGNDIFTIGNATVEISGDAMFFGDNFVAGTVSVAAAYQGGNDTIAGTATGARQVFFGDVKEINGAASLSGGKDLITIATSSEGEVYGDVGAVFGASSDRRASVDGGNDEIKGLATNAGLLLSGDVGHLGNFSTIVGGDDVILGAGGDDTIAGEALLDQQARGARIQGGDDDINAGAGNDLVVGESLGTFADQFLARAKGDALLSKTRITGGDDTISGGAGNDEIYGELRVTNAKELKTLSGGSDTLDGGEGNDLLFGQTGKDRLTGGVGKDFLEGGIGADTFVFASVEESTSEQGIDTISDFSRKQRDRIDISGLADGIASLDFAGRTRELEDGEFGFFAKKGNTFVFGDTSGDGEADFRIKFTGIIDFRESDFIL